MKCGGLGLRAYSELCKPAFIGAVPKLHAGFCPLLASTVGGEDRFGEEWAGRWQTLLDSGCRAGREFAVSWLRLTEEEVEGPLSVPVESTGEESVSGATRGMLISAREVQLGRALAHALEHHPEQAHRAVWSWPERDKLSAQFLLQLPGHISTLTSGEFSECTAALLCLPSPACMEKLGEVLGGEGWTSMGITW